MERDYSITRTGARAPGVELSLLKIRFDAKIGKRRESFCASVGTIILGVANH